MQDMVTDHQRNEEPQVSLVFTFTMVKEGSQLRETRFEMRSRDRRMFQRNVKNPEEV